MPRFARRTKGHMNSMIGKSRIGLLLLAAALAARAADVPQFAVKESHADSNGVTLRTSGGTMRVEVCGDRVVHVVASPTSEIPTPKVPIVTQPCQSSNVRAKIGKKEIRLSTGT